MCNYNTGIHICPSCGRIYEGYPALSRKDNRTRICPSCGATEAMEAYKEYLRRKSSPSPKIHK